MISIIKYIALGLSILIFSINSYADSYTIIIRNNTHYNFSATSVSGSDINNGLPSSLKYMTSGSQGQISTSGSVIIDYVMLTNGGVKIPLPTGCQIIVGTFMNSNQLFSDSSCNTSYIHISNIVQDNNIIELTLEQVN